MTQRTNAKSSLFTSIVALFLCVAMFTGTTFAWFTDSVTSSGNIIQTGTLDIEMNWANGAEEVPANGDTAWKDASKEAIFNYENWEPGYTDAKHIQIKNVGTLALNYQLRIVAEGTVSKLADVIDVYYFTPATKVDRTSIANAVDVENADDTATVIKLGTLADILGTAKNISNTVKGQLLADTTKEITLVLKMKEDAGNEYQNLSIGSGFSVELIATQATYEADSFDDQYDAGVPSPEVPAALVRPLEELDINATIGIGGPAEKFTLAAGYKFEPTISADEVLLSEYKHWHPDFFVYADKDVEAGSIALAGYYEAWCSLNNDNWVALVNDGLPVSAGEENGIRLVKELACVTYKDICEYGNDGKGFQCGLAAIDAEALAGTTITVEFRLYETEGEWSDSSHTCTEVASGNYITLGTFEYTFPGEKVTNNEELAAAITAGKTALTLAAGTYQMPAVAQGKTLTIMGENAEDVIIEVVGTGAGEAGGQLDYSLDGSNVTFKNVTIKTNGATYAGYARLTATYNNCIMDNTYCLNNNSVFNNCTFNVSGDRYNVWTWGAPEATFNNCTFNSDGKAVLLYGTVNTKLTVTDCVFNDNGGLTDLKAAIEIGNDYGKSYELIVDNTVVNGYEINDKGINTGTTLWGNKNSMTTDNLNVVVDGVDVY